VWRSYTSTIVRVVGILDARKRKIFIFHLRKQKISDSDIVLDGKTIKEVNKYGT